MAFARPTYIAIKDPTGRPPDEPAIQLGLPPALLSNAMKSEDLLALLPLTSEHPSAVLTERDVALCATRPGGVASAELLFRCG